MKKLTFRHSLSAIFLFLLVTIWATTAMAQDPIPNGRPILGEHQFTETVDVPSPFVRSFIRNRMGAGKAFNLTTPVYQYNGQTVGGFQGSLLFAIIDFEYQYAIKPWVAVRARVFGSGRLGSDTFSLLSSGVTMSTGFEFGWLIRLSERESSALSLDLNISDRSFTGVNIVEFVEDVVEENPASLVRKTPSARSSVGLRYAWAASEFLGVSARAEGGYGESIDRSRGDVWFYSLSGALDFDLRSKSSVPMGIALGYGYDSFPELSEDIVQGVHSVFFRFSYLGRDDFLLSLDLSSNQVPLSKDRPAMDGVAVTISLRYYI